MRWRGGLLLALLALTPLLTTAATDPITQPDPTVFGTGWSRVQPIVTGPGDALVWSHGSYAGPTGARLFLLLYRAEDATAIQAAWNATLASLAPIKTRLDHPAAGPTTPLPGCTMIWRLSGFDPVVLTFPVGFTLCADPAGGRLILAETSGAVFGKTGTAASDAVVSRIIAAKPAPSA